MASPFNSARPLSHGAGSVIRALRLAREMTQQQLADQSGVSLSTIMNVENMNKQASMRTGVKILRALLDETTP